MRKKNQSKFMGWVRTSLPGHILLFGAGAGGIGGILFFALLATEGPISLVLFINVLGSWILTMGAIGTLFWFSVTRPALKRKELR